jgi:myosin heavy subunit
MLPKTHEKIANEIAEHLGIENAHDIALLAKGSIKPDSLKVFPHHEKKQDEIGYHLIRARAEFIDKDDSWLEHLGLALHYIQDMWTLHPRLENEYTEWEKQIDNAKIMEEDKFIEYVKKAAIPTRGITEYLSLLNEIKEQKFPTINIEEILIFSCKGRPEDAITYGWSDPTIDLNFSYKLCLMLTKYITDTSALKKKKELEKEHETMEKQLLQIKNQINDIFPDGKKIMEETAKLNEKINELAHQNATLEQKKNDLAEKINSLQKEEDRLKKGLGKLYHKKSVEQLQLSRQKLKEELDPILSSINETQGLIQDAQTKKIGLEQEFTSKRVEQKIDEKLSELNFKELITVDYIKTLDQSLRDLKPWIDYLDIDEKSTKYRDQYIEEWGFPPP